MKIHSFYYAYFVWKQQSPETEVLVPLGYVVYIKITVKVILKKWSRVMGNIAMQDHHPSYNLIDIFMFDFYWW